MHRWQPHRGLHHRQAGPATSAWGPAAPPTTAVPLPMSWQRDIAQPTALGRLPVRIADTDVSASAPAPSPAPMPVTDEPTQPTEALQASTVPVSAAEQPSESHAADAPQAPAEAVSSALQGLQIEPTSAQAADDDSDSTEEEPEASTSILADYMWPSGLLSPAPPYAHIKAAGALFVTLHPDTQQLHIFMVKQKGQYTLPGGKRQEGEDPLSVAVREVEEETHWQITQQGARQALSENRQLWWAEGKYILFPAHLPGHWRLPRRIKNKLKRGEAHPEALKCEGAEWVSMSDILKYAWRRKNVDFMANAVVGLIAKDLPVLEARLRTHTDPAKWPEGHYQPYQPKRPTAPVAAAAAEPQPAAAATTDSTEQAASQAAGSQPQAGMLVTAGEPIAPAGVASEAGSSQPHGDAAAVGVRGSAAQEQPPQPSAGMLQASLRAAAPVTNWVLTERPSRAPDAPHMAYDPTRQPPPLITPSQAPENPWLPKHDPSKRVLPDTSSSHVTPSAAIAGTRGNVEVSTKAEAQGLSGSEGQAGVSTQQAPVVATPITNWVRGGHGSGEGLAGGKGMQQAAATVLTAPLPPPPPPVPATVLAAATQQLADGGQGGTATQQPAPVTSWVRVEHTQGSKDQGHTSTQHAPPPPPRSTHVARPYRGRGRGLFTRGRQANEDRSEQVMNSEQPGTNAAAGERGWRPARGGWSGDRGRGFSRGRRPFRGGRYDSYRDNNSDGGGFSRQGDGYRSQGQTSDAATQPPGMSHTDEAGTPGGGAEDQGQDSNGQDRGSRPRRQYTNGHSSGFRPSRWRSQGSEGEGEWQHKASGSPYRHDRRYSKTQTGRFRAPSSDGPMTDSGVNPEEGSTPGG